MRFPFRLGWLLSLAPLLAPAQVVINEILYHAPDELDDLQFVELHNAGGAAVDLGGWTFTKGIKFTFPAGARIEAHGYVVVCRDAARFREFYPVPVAGVFASKLSRKGERIELADATGKRVDAVKFGDQAPWPRGADGHSGSLERICPTAASDDAANWISSPLSETREQPAGTPGKPNAGFAATLPPVITAVRFAPDLPAPNQPITVEAELRAGEVAERVELLYRLAGPGSEGQETKVAMTSPGAGRFAATIPGQAAERLIRFRVRAIGPKGAVRNFPAETEPRPALSAYVPGAVEPAKIPFGWIIHTTEKEVKAAEARASAPMFGEFRPPPPDPDNEAREVARRMFEERLDLSSLWFALSVRVAAGEPRLVSALRPVLVAKLAERRQLIDTALAGPGVADRLEGLPATADAFLAGVVTAAQTQLSADQKQALSAWVQAQPARIAAGERKITSRADLEGAWHAVSLNAEPEPARLAALLGALRDLDRERAVLVAEVAAGTGKDRAFKEQRNRAESLGDRIAPALKLHLSAAQQEQLDRWSNLPREVTVGFREAPRGLGGPPPGFTGGLGGPGGPGFVRGGPFGQAPSEPGSFRSAFVHFDPATRKTELFDFVQINGRKGGQKVHLDRDRALAGMTTFALIFEGETAALVEPLAYEVYRRAGMPTEQSHHVRLWVNGKPAGYTVLVEQPNRAFLRRHQIKDDGNMYKLLWFGGDLIGQHEKHTNKRLGHADLVAVVEGLERNQGDALWKFIQEHFDVEEVATYFAVNMVLSHWDGFFNNYFTYHDVGGTEKWMMFPWDQDSTWGLRFMGGGDEVFTTMALTFGMNGDQPPADGGAWRAPGFFSGPLLANPQFRQVFLARTKYILENVYTESVFGPVLDRYAEQLTPEVKLRAELQRQDPERAVASLRSDLARARQHLRLRREFLLAQPELKRVAGAGPGKSGL